MTRDDLLELIADVQQLQSELDDIEVKAAQGGTPQRLYEPLSAFANRNGGVILFGLDESRDFEIVGVGNAQRLQEEISHLAAAEMEPALRPEFTVEDINGKTVVAAEIFDLSPEQKPCFYRPAGLQKGCYIQIRLFADRLEIQSPGGLYGNVSVEALEEEQSTRNRVLMRLMEDLHVKEMVC